jgi:hypothetical protein
MDVHLGLTNRQIFARLRKTDTALTGQVNTQPVIVFRHRRWCLLTVSELVDADWEMRDGIFTVNFMSEARARKTIHDWIPYSRLTPLDEVCPGFRAELEAKVLPTAEAYRDLLENGWVTPAGGWTTDTLHAVGTASVDAALARIAAWMEAGEMGPFLSFERTADVFQKNDRSGRNE